MDPIQKVESSIKPLARVAAVAGVVAGLGAIWWFFLDSIYHPSVKILDVDYTKGIANIEYKDYFGRTKKQTLYSGSTISAGGHWGVQFGGPDNGDYNRVELLKNDITYKTLNLSPAEFGDQPPPSTI